MPPVTPVQPDGTPRRPLGPRDTPRSVELIAALAILTLLVHLLLAQLTLVLAAVLYATGRVSRWRLQWLAVPAGAGLLWTLAVGLPRAAAGLTAGPRQVLAYLGGIGRHPGRLLHLPDAFAGLTHWLPGQFPLALILAAAEALALCWWQLYWQPRQRGVETAWRPGLIVAARRFWTTASLRSGGVVTRDGCCLGVDLTTGRSAAISWPEAEGGVLCAAPAAGVGLAPAGVGLAPAVRPAQDLAPAAQSGFMLARAAIRRRKPVIVIDLAGPAWPGSGPGRGVRGARRPAVALRRGGAGMLRAAARGRSGAGRRDGHGHARLERHRRSAAPVRRGVPHRRVRRAGGGPSRSPGAGARRPRAAAHTGRAARAGGHDPRLPSPPGRAGRPGRRLRRPAAG